MFHVFSYRVVPLANRGSVQSGSRSSISSAEDQDPLHTLLIFLTDTDRLSFGRFGLTIRTRLPPGPSSVSRAGSVITQDINKS